MTDKGGLKILAENIRSLPQNVWRSFARHGAANAPRSRAQAVMGNLFLHVHSTRTHRWSLKPTFTLGLGVASAVLFAILTVTGVMLMVYFKPTTAEAYNSVKDIHYVVTGGRLLRNVHRWATNLMVITVILHMARVFFTASYKAPREFNWLTGLALLVVTLGLSFTGYCLPWDQLGYWAIVIGSNIAGSFSEITQALHLPGLANLAALPRHLLLGSDRIGDDALLRIYWLHCIALPVSMGLLIAVHFWRIRKDGGLSRPEDINPDELDGAPIDPVADAAFSNPDKTYSLMCVVPATTPAVDQQVANTVQSWPHAFRAEMAISSTVLALVLVLATFFNAPLKEPADPAVPENPAKAPWYFLGLQEIVSYSAFAGGMAIPTLSILGLALIPYMDREPGESGRWPSARERRWAVGVAATTLVTTAVLLGVQVTFGWLRDWFPDVNQLFIVLINPGTLMFSFILAMSLGATWRTRSTRIGAVVFFSGLLVFFVFFTYFGTVHRGPNWDFYWWPTQWPEH